MRACILLCFSCITALFRSLTWSLSSAVFTPAGASYAESLTPIAISKTVPSWNTTTLILPPKMLPYGFYKAVFNLTART
jgi:hypothetical protein